MKAKFSKMFRRPLTRIEIKLDDIKEFDRKKKKENEQQNPQKEADQSSTSITSPDPAPSKDAAAAQAAAQASANFVLRRMRLGFTDWAIFFNSNMNM